MKGIMKGIMKVKAKNHKSLCGLAGFFLFCIVTVFQDYISSSEKSNVIYFIYIVSMLLSLYGIIRQGKLSISFRSMSLFYQWILIAISFVLVYNIGIRKHSYFTTIRWLFFFLYMILISQTPKDRYLSMIKILGAVASLYVIGVYFFLLFPQFYSGMYQRWGYWPTGTNGGTAGYRAGLASHYSENAMVITVLVLILASFYFIEPRKRNKRRIMLLGIIAISALVLTTKRAHLLFGFLSLVFAYYIFKPNQRTNRMFKVIIIGTIGFALLYIAQFFVPSIALVFERFSTIGNDTESMTRFSMWALAWNLFRKNPIFGIGWNGYKYQFFQYLYDPKMRAERYAYLNAHNVYLQLLAETGIIGFSLYMSGVISVFRRSINALTKKDKEIPPAIKSVLLFSISMQTFFLLYSMTGNCLYDIMFAFYAVAVGCAVGCYCQSDISNS